MKIDLKEAEKILAKLQDWSHALSLECIEYLRLLNLHTENQASPILINPLQPTIRMDGQNLWLDQLLIPLSTRERTLKLIGAFFTNKDLSLSKRALIAHVYQDSPEHASERLTLALEFRLIKLMSRTRRFLDSTARSSAWKKRIDWFVYDQKTKTYRLYDLKQISSFGEHDLLH